MSFIQSNNLSELIEKSHKEPIIIFKYSETCNSSSRLSNEFEKGISEKKIGHPIYIIVVQKQPALSKNVSEYFEVKHESPQVLVVDKGKLSYTAHHSSIKIEDLT